MIKIIDSKSNKKWNLDLDNLKIHFFYHKISFPISVKSPKVEVTIGFFTGIYFLN